MRFQWPHKNSTWKSLLYDSIARNAWMLAARRSFHRHLRFSFSLAFCDPRLRVFLQSTKLLQSDLIDVSMQSLVDLLCFENTLSRNMKLRINEMPDYVFTRYRTIDIGIDRDTMKIIDKFSKNKSY